jgi:O-succinylbenzoate synthase
VTGQAGLRERLSALLPTVRAFAIPMPARFRGITVREGALIEGPAGWGEFSPFAEYGPRECARWLACALEAAVDGWPEPVRDHVGVNVTVPAVGPERARQIVAGSGCRTAKVKVAEPGQADSDDIARVAAVRDALGADGRIRVDANGGWSVEDAARMLRELAPLRLEYAEQPCASLAELAELRRRVDVPLAADESIRRAEDPLAVRAAGAADIVVALAAALPELPYDCGLATMSLLAGDVTAEPLTAQGGMLPVRAAAVDPQHLSAYETDPAPWIARMLAAAEFLDTGVSSTGLSSMRP